MNILIDDLKGDTKGLFHLIQQEVTKREVPDVAFSKGSQIRAKKGGLMGALTGGDEEVPSLVMADKIQKVEVLAYQFGRSFMISARASWLDKKFAAADEMGKLMWLEEAFSGCFTESVYRAVRAAVAQYLQQAQRPIPPSLDPKEIFVRREKQGTAT